MRVIAGQRRGEQQPVPVRLRQGPLPVRTRERHTRGRRDRHGRGEGGGQVRVRVDDELREQLVAAGEVAVQRGAGHAELLGAALRFAETAGVAGKVVLVNR